MSQGKHFYTVTGRVTFRGATVTVQADSPEEALEKAGAGEWVDRSLDTDCAEMSDYNFTKAELDD